MPTPKRWACGARAASADPLFFYSVLDGLEAGNVGCELLVIIPTGAVSVDRTGGGNDSGSSRSEYKILPFLPFGGKILTEW